MKMKLRSPLFLGVLLILFVQGTPTKGRVVTLRREKRDTDILVACDEHCLPTNQIKDFDVLLQYDEEEDSTPGPFLFDFEKKSCAFPCKIVHVNKTKGSNENLGGEFTVVSVEVLPDENVDEPTNTSDFNPFKPMVGQRKNLTFSPSISENSTIKTNILNTTSICTCTNSSANITSEITSPTSKQINGNSSESNLGSKKSSSLLVRGLEESTTGNIDFMEHNVTENETTTQNQQLSVIPVIPKVIRYTIVEAEMAEPRAPANSSNAEKLQDKNNYGVSNNTSSVLNSILEKLTPHGVQGLIDPLKVLGLGNYSFENEKSLIGNDKNVSSSTLSSKESEITEVTTQTLPSQGLISYPNMKSLSEKELQMLAFLISNMSTSSSQEKSPTPSSVTVNDSPIVNVNETVTTTPLLLEASPSVTVTSIGKHEENSSKLIKPLTTESLIESKTTPGSPSINSTSPVIISSSNQTIIKPNSTITKTNCSSFNKTDESCRDLDSYPSKQNNITYSINGTKLKDNNVILTGNNTKVKLPPDSDNSSTISNTSAKVIKNNTLLSLYDSESSLLPDKYQQLADLTSPLDLHIESFIPDNLSKNITETINEETVSNQPSILSNQHLPDMLQSTSLSNITESSIYYNITTVNKTYEPSKFHPENSFQNVNNTKETSNGTTTLHQIL